MNIAEIEESFACKSPRPCFKPVLITDTNRMSRTTKRRLIHAPNTAMSSLHTCLIKELRPYTHQKMPSACGGVKGGSVVQTLLRHKNRDGTFKRYLYALDLKNAYSQVCMPKLAEILYSNISRELFLSAQTAEKFLKKYCMREPTPGLVIGGGSSPDLFNIYCEYMIDQALRRKCDAFDITYTRYIDDLLFSSDHPIGKKKRQALRSLIVESGFIVEDRKSHVYDLSKNPVAINGITLHLYGTMSIPGPYLRKIQGVIHRAKHFNDVDLQKIQGMVNMIRQVAHGRRTNATERKILDAFCSLKDNVMSFS